MIVKGLFEIDEFSKMGLNGGKMGEKGGEKEKFSFGVICGEKSEKAPLSAYGRLRRKTARMVLTQANAPEPKATEIR